MNQPEVVKLEVIELDGGGCDGDEDIDVWVGGADVEVDVEGWMLGWERWEEGVGVSVGGMGMWVVNGWWAGGWGVNGCDDRYCTLVMEVRREGSMEGRGDN